MPPHASTDSKPAAASADLQETNLEDRQKPALPSHQNSQTVTGKKPRAEEIPLYARSSRKVTKNPFLLGKRSFKPSSTATFKSTTTIMANQNASPRPVKAHTNGHRNRGTDGQAHSSNPSLLNGEPLGTWEPSIINVIPYEEVTKAISDFLFSQVVLQDHVGVVSAKGVHTDAAVFEIEAKIGKIIDQNTGSRLDIPVATECVLRKDSKLRTNFESSMTEVLTILTIAFYFERQNTDFMIESTQIFKRIPE